MKAMKLTMMELQISYPTTKVVNSCARQRRLCRGITGNASFIYAIISGIIAVVIPSSFIHFTLTTSVPSSRLSTPMYFVIVVHRVLFVGCWLSPETVCCDNTRITQRGVFVAIEAYLYVWYVICEWLWWMVWNWTDHRWSVIISHDCVGVSKSPPLKRWGVNFMLRKQSHRCDWMLLLFSIAGYRGLPLAFLFGCNPLHRTRRAMLRFDLRMQILHFETASFGTSNCVMVYACHHDAKKKWRACLFRCFLWSNRVRSEVRMSTLISIPVNHKRCDYLL